MLLTEELSQIVGEAFAREGFDAGLGAVRISDRPDLGQFQCNGALAAAKAAKKNPREIGEVIAARLRALSLFADVSLAGPGFLNLSLTDAELATRVERLASDERLGGWAMPTPERIVVDYGGPNVAKPLHVGHLRAAIIGESIKRLFRFVGNEVIGDIHLGDWGLQM
ncbi:MAG: arginine--tRNA ligase, partial [Parvularculaceae bacterium]|nr:arginine--tRNA ligase [Parvularculaceae bacterium]